MSGIDAGAVRRYLEKVQASEQFQKSDACRRLLRYLVERALAGEVPKEFEIAIDVFGKDASFNGAEDSVVRVAVRSLRQRLREYYAGAGRDDALHFAIPKGGYRLEALPRAVALPQPPVAERQPRSRALVVGTVLGVLALGASLLTNVYFWLRAPRTDESPARARLVDSAVWADLHTSDRRLTLVLGDTFMFTQLDPATGRTLTVRDTSINSSEELRAFLASNPSLAADRGQRYVSYFTRSAVLGMTSVLRMLDRPGRQVEVRVLEELQAEDIQEHDIVYVGPFARLGPLIGHYLQQLRYDYDAQHGSLTDTLSHQSYLPAGELSHQRTDYGLIAKFQGPSGNHIMVFASVARNVGLQQIVSTLTSVDGLAAFESKWRDRYAEVPSSFEALVAVTGFRRTDLAAEVVDVNALPAPHLARSATAARAGP